MIFMNQRLIQQLYFIAIALTVLSGSYLAIAGSTVDLATVQWDEFTDLTIASALSERPLSGHSWDGSQARFPMYVTAVAQRVTQLFIPNPDLLEVILPISRWLSILMTVLAIWGTFMLGYRLFDITTGLLGATLFTFSPYVLQFGYGALTHSDAFTSATVVFALIAFERFDTKRTTLWLAYFSFFLALAIAAKFFLVILIPAFITFHVLLELNKRYRYSNPLAGSIQVYKNATTSKSYITLVIGVGVLALVALTVSLQRFNQPPVTNQMLHLISRLVWLITLLGIILSFLVAFKNSGRWRLIKAWPAIISLTTAIVLALFPAHIFNPNVIPTLLERFITMDGNSNLLATALVSIKLYFGLILLKLGLPFGIATWVALIWAIRKSIKNKAFFLVMLVMFYYGVLLVVLPLQQPFWLMSVYPLITLILSAMIVEGLTRLTMPKLRLVWVAFIIFAFGWLAVGLLQVYPTFGYYGYELVGARWLGIESRGYRALVTVTNDGSTEAIDWLRQNASSESVVYSYLDDPHIIKYLDSKEPFAFELKHVITYQDKNDIGQELLPNADFVVVRTFDNTDIPLPTSEPAFIQKFGSDPVYQIFRGRGIYRMPVIQIYQRMSSRVRG